MSGGAKRSPLDALVLPQPMDLSSEKMDKITKKSSTRPRGSANFWSFFYFFISLSMGCREEQVIIRFPLIYQNPPFIENGQLI